MENRLLNQIQNHMQNRMQNSELDVELHSVDCTLSSYTIIGAISRFNRLHFQ